MLQYETSPELRAMADAAVRAEKITRFPAAVMLAVWACESNYGKNVTGDFNYWGITRDPKDGPAKFCLTHENITPAQLLLFRPDEWKTAVQGKSLGGGHFRYAMSRWFASYASLDESVIAYTRFFTESPQRYAGAWTRYLETPDADRLLTDICEAGYATGNAMTVELAILHQSNIKHAVEMSESRLLPVPGNKAVPDNNA